MNLWQARSTRSPRRGWGRFDVAANNAGYAFVGPLEDTSMDEIRAQFETNLFDALRVMKAAIPIMRRQGTGVIVNITSMGGRVAIPLDPIYHGTKFALEGITESVRYESMPFGIKVILVEPGAVRTNFFGSLKVAKDASDPKSPYAKLMGGLQAAADHMADEGIQPEQVAATIVEAATSRSPPMRIVVGEDAKTLIRAKKEMGDEDFGKMITARFFGNS
jgi:short-subunit dehydrogenase